MLNVSPADNGACQLIYGHPWNCLSDAWRGWLTNSGRVNKHRQSDKSERGRHKERDNKGEPLGWTRKLRVTPRKHGRHLSICPQDTKADANYFILWLCCLSQQRAKFWNKSDIRPFVYDAVSAIKVSLAMSIQATKGLMWHLSSMISLHGVCPYTLPRSAETSDLSTICLNQLPLFPFGLDTHSILKPAAPSSAITTCMSTYATSAPACLAATHLTIMPFRIIAQRANSS